MCLPLFRKSKNVDALMCKFGIHAFVEKRWPVKGFHDMKIVLSVCECGKVKFVKFAQLEGDEIKKGQR